MSQPDDAELIARHRSDDRSAFDEIVDRYEHRVFAVAMRITRHHDDARDVTQEVFITALRSLGGFRGEARLSTWLHRVAVNAALDVVRRRSRHETSDVEELSDSPAAGPGPETQALEAVRAQAVHRALGLLPPDMRAVVVLHDLQELNYAECAEALGVPVGTVKSRLHRARLQLARGLGHLREAEPADGGSPLR